MLDHAQLLIVFECSSSEAIRVGLPNTPPHPPSPPRSFPAERPEGLSLLSCGALCPLSKCRHIPLPSAYDLTAPVCLTPSPKTNLIIALQNMDSADSQWILPLRAFAYLCICAAHARLQLNSSRALGRDSVSPVFHGSLLILCQNMPYQVHFFVGVYVDEMRVQCVSLHVSMMSGKLITQICLRDLTLMTSLTHLLDLLGNFQQEHTF